MQAGDHAATQLTKPPKPRWPTTRCSAGLQRPALADPGRPRRQPYNLGLALANVALDRSLADNPRYSMALLLREALDSGAPPVLARLPMTPEEVAAAYDTADQAGAPGGA